MPYPLKPTGVVNRTLPGPVTPPDASTGQRLRQDQGWDKHDRAGLDIFADLGGVDGDDCTTEITDGLAYAMAAGVPLLISNGRAGYDGPGLSGIESLALRGNGRGSSAIELADGYLIDQADPIDVLDVSDLTISGGVGLLRSTSTDTNVAGFKTFNRVMFKDYTGAAIVSFSEDEPWWKFRNCQWWAAGYDDSIGFALAGWSDSVSFVDCSFLINRVHLKVGRGAQSLYLNQCDFLRIDNDRPNGPAIDIWVVPAEAADYQTSGHGFRAASCKFGPEVMVAGDLRVVYADEDGGGDFGTQFPDLATPSTGVVTGHQFDGCFLGGSDAAPGPFIFSTTPDLRSFNINLEVNAIYNVDPLVEFEDPLAVDRLNCDSVVRINGPGVDSETTPTPRISNADGWAKLIDPTGLHVGNPTEIPTWQSGDPVGYVPILTALIRSFSVGGGPSLSNVTDAFGGTDATEATYDTTPGGVVLNGLVEASMTAGNPAWIEFDLKAGSSSALELLRVTVQNDGPGLLHLRKVVRVPAAGWARYRFAWTPRDASVPISLLFDSISTAGKVQIGRVRMYHAREPVDVDNHMVGLNGVTLPITGVAVTAGGVHAALVSLGLITA